MSVRPPDFTLKGILPPNPGQWFWTRLKVYLSVSLLVAAGFFTVAGWLADPGVSAGVTFGLLAVAWAAWTGVRRWSKQGIG